MKVVGLTGGMGAGKTMAAQIFSSLGIPVYDSDGRAKYLYIHNAQLRGQMMGHFGSDIYLGEQINKRKLSEIIFNDTSELQTVNEMVHPVISADFNAWKNKQNTDYVIRESAILIESKANLDCDYIVIVWAPLAIRISRIQARDGLKKSEIEARIANQLTDNQRSGFADFTVLNDRIEMDQGWVFNQVFDIHTQLHARIVN